MPKVKSKRQWRRFGAMLNAGEMTRKEFDKRVHGVDHAKLPETVAQAKSAKRARKAATIRRAARGLKRRKRE